MSKTNIVQEGGVGGYAGEREKINNPDPRRGPGRPSGIGTRLAWLIREFNQVPERGLPPEAMRELRHRYQAEHNISDCTARSDWNVFLAKHALRDENGWFRPRTREVVR